MRRFSSVNSCWLPSSDEQPDLGMSSSSSRPILEKILGVWGSLVNDAGRTWWFCAASKPCSYSWGYLILANYVFEVIIFALESLAQGLAKDAYRPCLFGLLADLRALVCSCNEACSILQYSLRLSRKCRGDVCDDVFLELGLISARTLELAQKAMMPSFPTGSKSVSWI